MYLLGLDYRSAVHFEPSRGPPTSLQMAGAEPKRSSYLQSYMKTASIFETSSSIEDRVVSIIMSIKVEEAKKSTNLVNISSPDVDLCHSN